MRTTLAPVLLNAGFRSNVIPGTAQATLNVRIIPGTDVDALRVTLERFIGDPLDQRDIRGSLGRSRSRTR